MKRRQNKVWYNLKKMQNTSFSKNFISFPYIKFDFNFNAVVKIKQRSPHVSRVEMESEGGGPVRMGKGHGAKRIRSHIVLALVKS